jgi:ATP-binding cassette subfamily F protein 3
VVERIVLKIIQVTKRYADRIVLNGVSAQLGPGERVGLIGPNGSGKSSLLRIAAGLEPADSGRVALAPTLRVGYLTQGLEAAPGETVGSRLADAGGDLAALEAAVARAGEAWALAPGSDEHEAHYLAALQRLERAGAAQAAAHETLVSLGLADLPMSQPVLTLSGGQRTRLGLALTLLAGPDLLLLDEPTNHLDLEMLAWLAEWLERFPGAALIVSHDRAFLDETVTRILELDPLTQHLRSFPGTYADYLDSRQAEIEDQRQAYADWQDEITRLRDTARRLRGLTRMKRGGKADDGDKFAKGFFNDQSARMAKRAKTIERRLDRLMGTDRVNKPARAWTLKVDLETASAGGRDVLRLESLSVGYDRPLLTDLNVLIRHGERVVLLGPNGSGKTTLLRTVLGEVPPLAGVVRLGSGIQPGYFAQHHDGLDPAQTPLDVVRQVARGEDTELRRFLHRFLFAGDGVFTPIGALSYGERARLALAVLVAQGCNFLVLDEPINHLDIASRERFEEALLGFDGTALIVTHDRYFIDCIATRRWVVRERTLTLEDTESE